MNTPSKLARYLLQGWGLIDLPLRASNDINDPSELARYLLQRVAWIGPNVRASNEALLRARVPRAQGPTRLPFSSLIGDDPGRLEAAETVSPECGRVYVKDAERIRRQERPRPLEHFISQLPRSPPGKSGKSPEGFGRFGLFNDAFQDASVPPT